jgi:hypothetical protein
MHVIHVPGVVGVVPDRGLPEAPLPDAALAAGSVHLRTGLGGRQGSYQADLDGLDAVGEVVVTRWEGGDAMHMLGQHYPGIDMEGPLRPGAPYCVAEQVDVAGE